MLKFSFLLLILVASLFGSEQTFYKKYQSLADPLYCPWKKDKTFSQINNSYFYKDFSDDVSYARYLQYVLTRHVLATIQEGDIIECGVCGGKSLDVMASACDLFDKKGRTLYGIDSFEGLSTPGLNDHDVRNGQQFFKNGSCSGGALEHIQQLLSIHHNPIKLIKGWIPAPFIGLENCQFCLAHIDVDLYQPTKDCLIFIYPRMLKGGIILFDDYGFPMCPGARKAIDDYLADKPEALIPIPSGQAFIIKQ